MPGIIDRIGSLAGTELGKAIDLAHRFYQERMGVHNHTGRALIETAAEVARNHPNLVGIGVGLLVEQFLAEQKRRHDVHMAEMEAHPELATPSHADRAAKPESKSPATHGLPDIHYPLVHHDLIQLHTLRPGRIAFEVFGALALLKLASTGVRWFRHDKQHEVWFAPAARIRLWSGTIAAYYLAKSLKSPKLSAWRNAAVALFATDALKPVLKGPKRRKKGDQPYRPVAPAIAHAPAAPPAPRPPAPAEPNPAPADVHPTPPAAEPAAPPALH